MGKKRGWKARKRTARIAQKKLRETDLLWQSPLSSDWIWLSSSTLKKQIKDFSQLDSVFSHLRPSSTKASQKGDAVTRLGVPNLSDPGLTIDSLVAVARHGVAVTWSLKSATLLQLIEHFSSGGSTKTIPSKLSSEMVADALACYSEIEGLNTETSELINICLPWLDSSQAQITVAHLTSVLEREASDLLEDMGAPIQRDVEMLTRLKVLYPDIAESPFDDLAIGRIARFYFSGLALFHMYTSNPDFGKSRKAKTRELQHLSRNRIAHRISTDQLTFSAAAVLFSQLVSVVKERKQEEILSQIQSIKR